MPRTMHRAAALTFVLALFLLAAACYPSRIPDSRASEDERILTMLVVDFVNRDESGISGSELTRRATDEVAGRLAKSDRIRVVGRAEVERAVKDLGIAPPCVAAAIRKLAARLHADEIVTRDRLHPVPPAIRRFGDFRRPDRARVGGVGGTPLWGRTGRCGEHKRPFR